MIESFLFCIGFIERDVTPRIAEYLTSLNKRFSEGTLYEAFLL